MNYREQFYEGEIDGKTLLDVIDEKEAEAQALREELKNECKIAAFWNEQAEKYKAEAEALRARVVVVPGRQSRKEAFECGGVAQEQFATGWNYCLEELARLNGKAVSEGLLRRMLRDWESNDTVALWGDMEELQELLGEGKEHE